MKKLTFIDSGVLIAVARGQEEVARRAVAIIEDPQREWACSDFVRLEVLPKPVYLKKQDEVDFYTTFFAGVRIWVSSSKELAQKALEEAKKFGLSAMDALHVAGAVFAKAEEIVTTEKSSTSLCKVTSVRVSSILPTQTP